MKKRIVLLTTLAAMLVAAMALSGVAQAAPTIGSKADAKCLAEAAKTVEQPGFNPSNYTFHGGTEGIDDSAYFNAQATAGPDVFCGFGGDDEISAPIFPLTLAAGDIFLGGAGDDIVGDTYGTVYGGAGNDFVYNNYGTFYGGAGDDVVSINYVGATFYGGAGNDLGNDSTFYGQEGDDSVLHHQGTFYQ